MVVTKPVPRPDPLVELRAAVMRLTSPFNLEQMVRVSGGGRRMHVTTHQPLIAQLRDAIRSTTGANANGSSPQSRSVMDADAYDKYRLLGLDLRTAWDQLPVPASHYSAKWSPEYSLLTLHQVATEAPPRTWVQRQARVWSGWVQAIEGKFEPPQTITITKPCPNCGEKWAISQGSGDRVYALILRFGGVRPPRAECRFCGTVWDGQEGVDRLARQQHRAQTTRRTTETATA